MKKCVLKISFSKVISMNKYYVPTLALIVLLVLITLFGCQPIYKVSHRGFGVYTDTISVRYDSGNYPQFSPF